MAREEATEVFAGEVGFVSLEDDAIGEREGAIARDLEGDAAELLEGHAELGACVLEVGMDEDADATDVTFPTPELLVEGGGGDDLSIAQGEDDMSATRRTTSSAHLPVPVLLLPGARVPYAMAYVWCECMVLMALECMMYV